VSYVKVADADPAVVSLAWTRESGRPEVEAFIEVARRIASVHASQTETAASATN
jgi:hypothetical protein